MSKRIVLVGHCGPDSAYLRSAVKSAAKDATIISADDKHALEKVLAEKPELLLLNRELGYGYDQNLGVELIQALKASHPGQKTMLVSNYPDAQAAALAAGALPGFGKRELGSPKVATLLRQALGDAAAAPATAPRSTK